jgi:hypothetical protein
VLLELALIAFRVAYYGPAFLAFGLLCVLIVASLHLKFVTVKVRPFGKNLNADDYRVELRWGLVIIPIIVTWIYSFPVAGRFPVDYSIDIWKAAFFVCVMVWFLIEGIVRIRF